jgi:hypothetical protein
MCTTLDGVSVSVFVLETTWLLLFSVLSLFGSLDY